MDEALSPQKIARDGRAAYAQGDYRAAGRAYKAASEGAMLAGEQLMAAEYRNNSSVAYLQAGEAEEALSLVEGTPEIFAEANDIKRQGMALGNLGSALEAAGRLEQAFEAYQQSADLLKEAGESELRARVMQSLSALQLRTGRQLQALATMQAGLDGLEKPNLKQRALKKLLQAPFNFLDRS